MRKFLELEKIKKFICKNENNISENNQEREKLVIDDKNIINKIVITSNKIEN